ncbi:hypothetical protein BST25_20320 [Mycobacterium heidelbergense]|uniref:Uncharacterized protein n=1 Tax=Mycobacterium heidelbergense TaxID=53376 RepID=A0A1X0DCP4_MYCHE|nr:hypothetical protein BST25_20320 [Mycobacterium heidelbergense]
MASGAGGWFRYRPADESSIGSHGSIFVRLFLKYQVITVVAPNSPLVVDIPTPTLGAQRLAPFLGRGPIAVGGHRLASATVSGLRAI